MRWGLSEEKRGEVTFARIWENKGIFNWRGIYRKVRKWQLTPFFTPKKDGSALHNSELNFPANVFNGSVNKAFLAK